MCGEVRMSASICVTVCSSVVVDAFGGHVFVAELDFDYNFE